MLTRRLYRLDEACAALQWCILRGRIIEVAFWATELTESAAIKELRAAIQAIWLYGFGCRSLAWLPRILSDDSLIETAIGIARGTSRRDSSVLATLCLKPQEDRVTGVRLPEEATGLSEQQQFYLRAAIQGKVAPLWDWLGQAAEQTEIPWDDILRIGDLKYGDNASFKEVVQATRALQFSPKEAAAVLVAILAMRRSAYKESREQPLYTELPSEVINALADWSTLPMRRRRIFAIPAMCLHGTTQRGGLETTQRTSTELTRYLESTLAVSDFWKADYEESRRSDSAREEFFATHFPNDIPDEWSAAARDQSHGPGVIPPGATTWTLGRWIRSWFGTIPCSLVWNGVERAARYVDEEYEWDTHGGAWEALSGGLGEVGGISWNYRPVRWKIVAA